MADRPFHRTLLWIALAVQALHAHANPPKQEPSAASSRKSEPHKQQEPAAKGFERMLDAKTPLSHPASEKALQMLGVQYKWGGSSEASGMDCSGFVYRSYKDAVGLELPRTADQMAQKLDKVLPHEMRAGDLVFFNTLGRPNSHVGIYLGGSLFAHAPKPGQRARIDNIAESYWLSAFDGARRPSARPTREAITKALARWDPSEEALPAALPKSLPERPPLPPSIGPVGSPAALPPLPPLPGKTAEAAEPAVGPRSSPSAPNPADSAQAHAWPKNAPAAKASTGSLLAQAPAATMPKPNEPRPNAPKASSATKDATRALATASAKPAFASGAKPAPSRKDPADSFATPAPKDPKLASRPAPLDDPAPREAEPMSSSQAFDVSGMAVALPSRTKRSP